MKNILTIAAIAVLTIFTVVSCAPEAELTNYDYNAANKKDSALSVDYDYLDWVPVFADNNLTESDKTKSVLIDITFPEEADILKKVKDPGIEDLKRIISFNKYFTQAEPPVNSSKESTIETSVNYTYKIRKGNVIQVELPIPLNDYNQTTYNLVAVVYGKEYTFFNGLKLDRDGNGISGEDIYDNHYAKLTGGSAFTAPGNKDWSITIKFNHSTGSGGAIQPGAIWPSNTALTTNSYPYIELATLSGIATTINDNAAYEDTRRVYREVAAVFADKIKLQELDLASKKWKDIATAAYKERAGGFERYSIGIENQQFKHGSFYRVKWEGTPNIETPNIYYGVNQRIAVTSNDWASGRYYDEDTSTWNEPPRREMYKRTTAIGGDVYGERWGNNSHAMNPLWSTSPGPDPVEIFSNDGTFSLATGVPVIVPQDFSGKGVIVRVLVVKQGASINHATDPWVGLKKDSIDLNNFKVAYIYDKTGVPTDFNLFTEEKTNINYVKVKSVKFDYWGTYVDASSATVNNERYYNLLEIELDPSYKYTNSTRGLLLVINEKGLKFENDNYVFGDRSQWYNDNYRAYPITLDIIANVPTLP